MLPFGGGGDGTLLCRIVIRNENMDTNVAASQLKKKKKNNNV